MTVTLDGIKYEGTVDEIRDIVSNPPTRSTKHIQTEPPAVDFPKEEGINTHRHKNDERFREWEEGEKYKINDPVRPFEPPPPQPYMPTHPHSYPGTKSWPDDFPKQWDGTPIVTCDGKHGNESSVVCSRTESERASCPIY